MKHLISIIIPNYNHSKYLDERIQSILNQTYKNFEVIILDDCSPDNSKEVIEKYKNYPQITNIIYNETNSGSTFVQWNKGFELAKGEYIWIAESDDIADKNFLNKLVEKITNNKNCVLAFSNSSFIDSNSNIIPYKEHRKRLEELYINGTDFVKKYMLGINNIYNASAVIFKKNVLKNIDSSLYIKFKASGDRLFWILVCLQGNVCYIPEKLNYFRQHNNKVSPKALLSGIASKEDFQIYNFINNKINLNKLEKILVNGCHYWFNHRLTFDVGVKERINKMWKTSKDYNILSCIIFRIMYMFNYI